MRVVVIGGDAVGMVAASQVKRVLRDDASIIVIEQQSWTSYSACAIPYWVGGATSTTDAPIARTPEQHRANGIDVRTGMLATEIDPARQVAIAQPVTGGPSQEFEYDHLVLGTGSRAKTPPIDGLEIPGVHWVQTLDQGQAAIDALAAQPKCAVVLGAGYIGLEMAEASLCRSLDTTVLDQAAEPMASLDPDMGAFLRTAMVERGVTLRTSEPARRIIAGPDGQVRAVATDSGEYPADIVFVGLGMDPRTELAEAAGLPLGRFGGILTDPTQRVEGYDNIWSGGDCTEVVDRLTGERRYLPLGTHANKHGRVIGLNIVGRPAEFPGVIGTAITKFQDLEIARVGLRESEALDAGRDVATVTISATTKAGYMPGADPIRIKMLADRADGRVIGTQIIGGDGAGKRIDTAATAIWAGLTVADVVDMDLSYAPPFSPVWDPIQVAARALLPQL